MMSAAEVIGGATDRVNPKSTTLKGTAPSATADAINVGFQYLVFAP
jgi:hypothetical protein